MDSQQKRRKKSKPSLPEGTIDAIALRLGVRSDYVSRILHNPDKYDSVTARHIREIAAHIQEGLAEKAKQIAAEIIEEVTG